ncbi:hypothetical protein GBA52_012031 [Prunus armeniaca]|nr:hypothetical protein GBA52_012031 [Prunus armeniaca]
MALYKYPKSGCNLGSVVRVNSIHISSSDFYTAWDVIAKHVLDYREDTVLAHRGFIMATWRNVNIICGSCLNGQCTGGLGCICNVTYESSCRVFLELAIPCKKPGPRVFKGFTVGFHPRSWELVYDGMTQLGYEKSHHEFSFGTEQTHVTLYMTAIASLSTLVQRPIIKILPENGLEVKVSGSGATGSPPTTLSPTMLNVDWRCETARDTPYEVNITIPVEGYEPIQFFLAKLCVRLILPSLITTAFPLNPYSSENPCFKLWRDITNLNRTSSEDAM